MKYFVLFLGLINIVITLDANNFNYFSNTEDFNRQVLHKSYEQRVFCLFYPQSNKKKVIKNLIKHYKKIATNNPNYSFIFYELGETSKFYFKKFHIMAFEKREQIYDVDISRYTQKPHNLTFRKALQAVCNGNVSNKNDSLLDLLK